VIPFQREWETSAVLQTWEQIGPNNLPGVSGSTVGFVEKLKSSKHRLLLFVRLLLEVSFLNWDAEMRWRSRASLYCYCHGKEKQ